MEYFNLRLKMPKISNKKQTKQTFERTNKSKIKSKNKRTKLTVQVIRVNIFPAHYFKSFS